MKNSSHLAQQLANGADLVDIAYEYAKIDRSDYCRWVIDCATRLIPLCQQVLELSEVKKIEEALKVGVQATHGIANKDQVEEAAAVVRAIYTKYSNKNEEIDYCFLESFDAFENSIKITFPESGIYHEDVIYSARRAAFDGELHENETAESFEDEEIAGAEESEIEIAWQKEALLKKLAQV